MLFSKKTVPPSVLKHNRERLLFFYRQQQLENIRAKQRIRNGLATGEFYDDAGFDEYDYDREGFDRDGFNIWGNDRWGNPRPKRNDGLIDPFAWEQYVRISRLQICQNSPEHRDADGFDYEGYDIDGYDADGFDRDGLHRNGIDRIFRTPQDKKDWETLFGPSD